MVKDIVIVADLGAAGNLVRNLILLSDQVDWPLLTNRHATILSQYPTTLELENWLPVESKLRFWNKYYGVDISDNLDVDKFSRRQQRAKPVVYLNHSAFYQPTEFRSVADIATTMYVAPTTEFGLHWQIRSYCEKKTVKKLHNFTFETNVDNQIKQYCETHGVEAWEKLNVKNFQCIVEQRQKEFGVPDLCLEMLLSEPVQNIVDAIANKLNIAIDVESAEQVVERWRSLHWPLEQTMDWKYFRD